MKTKPFQFSRYNAPITNKYPSKVTTLYRIYIDITGNTLKKETLAVRADASKKPVILPYITASGIFKERNLSRIASYSSIVGIDLDHIDPAIKTRLFCDPFLKPALIFISPSGSGLKLFIRIEGGIPEHHNDYFNAISDYLYLNYGVNADPACRDISRACFLCHDYNAHFSATGRVFAADLLDISFSQQNEVASAPLVPSSPRAVVPSSPRAVVPSSPRAVVPSSPRAVVPSSPRAVVQSSPRSLVPSSPRSLVQSSTSLAPHSSCYDPYKVKIINDPPDDWVSKNIKSNPAIHAHAEQTLIAHGWHQNGDNWTRPGKEIKDGKSAIFNPPNAQGLCIFTVFSSNAHPFQIKGYNDFQIIALLDYHGDFKTCFIDLLARFKL